MPQAGFTQPSSSASWKSQAFPGMTGPPTPQAPAAPSKAPEQLQMFMSSREIMQRYRPLEGDKEERGNYEDAWDNQEGTQTWRRRNTQGYTNFPNREYEGSGMGSSRMTDEQGNKQYTRSHIGEMESDEELFDRKRDEAYDAYGRQGVYGGGWGQSSPMGTQSSVPAHTTWRSHGTEGQTLEPGRETSDIVTFSSEGTEHKHMRQLYQHPGNPAVPGKFRGTESLGESLEQHGYDWSHHTDPSHPRYQDPKYPIALEFQHEDWGGGELQPRSERPQIVGGHHRLAVMNNIAPGAYMPVVYAENIYEAQAKKGYT